MGYIQERYRPTVMAANATVTTPSSGLGGFLCVTSGTITVTMNNTAATPMLTAFPVLAGVYYPLVMLGDINGNTVVLAGGASGTLLVD